MVTRRSSTGRAIYDTYHTPWLRVSRQSRDAPPTRRASRHSSHRSPWPKGPPQGHRHFPPWLILPQADPHSMLIMCSLKPTDLDIGIRPRDEPLHHNNLALPSGNQEGRLAFLVPLEDRLQASAKGWTSVTGQVIMSNTITSRICNLCLKSVIRIISPPPSALSILTDGPSETRRSTSGSRPVMAATCKGRWGDRAAIMWLRRTAPPNKM